MEIFFFQGGRGKGAYKSVRIYIFVTKLRTRADLDIKIDVWREF